MTFCAMTVDSARSRLVQACGARGMKVYESAPDMLICGRPQPDLGGPLAQLLLGRSYSTVPETKVRFVLEPADQNVKVSGDQWVEAEMAMGRVDREPLDSPRHQEGLRQFLAAVAGNSCGSSAAVTPVSAPAPPAAPAPRPPETATSSIRATEPAGTPVRFRGRPAPTATAAELPVELPPAAVMRDSTQPEAIANRPPPTDGAEPTPASDDEFHSHRPPPTDAP